ncbi:MAG: Hpt domain-containing protein [Deltaproteobacteria bacterium]|nr:Hpt domain-containing protein [Deltaproteobacteria bacterium]
MSDSFNELDEIIVDFIQESRDMIDQLEPTIIELGQSCHAVNCWETLNCEKNDCSRHSQQVDFPCWLHRGYIGNGDQTCVFSDSEEGCKQCPVYEQTNGNGETMNAIFRLFHSMKGSAGFLELNNISGVAHAAENLLDRIRAGKIKMQNDHVDLLCQSCDFAKEALDQLETQGDDTGMGDQAEEMKKLLEDAVAAAEKAAEAIGQDNVEAAPTEQSAPGADQKTAEKKMDLDNLANLITPEMVNNFVQESDELLQTIEGGLLSWSENPENLEPVSDIFRNVHSFKGNCGFFGFSDPENLTHNMETLLDAVRDGVQLTAENPGEFLLSYLDVIKSSLTDISNGGRGEIEDLDQHIQDIKNLAVPRFGEIMVEKGLVEKEVIDEVLAKKKRPVGDYLVEMGKVTQDQVEEALSEQTQKKYNAPPVAKTTEKAKPASGTAKRQDIRVDLGKLDDLINVIGEMVIAENMLVNNPDLQDLELENFNKAAQQMGKLIRELQEMAMTIRMIPVSGLFKRMIRLVHDLSVKSGKKVDLKLLGEETEVDKTVVETITDPLVHLLRNSLDHGLETPAERIQNGKSEKGTVKLSARHEEGEVWITVEDDGRGLNKEKIIEKARSKGLIQGDGSDMSDKAIFGLIFHAGFSTADKITDVSGRGVGMDVVKQNLEKIKGKIEVQSQPGKGTQLKLRIPLTLAIIDGMLVRVGKTKCIAPLISIREIIRPSAKDITVTPNGQQLAKIREKFFPIHRLADVLQKPTDCENIEESVLVVMEDQGTSFCLQVDEILGQQQTVIKGLSDYIGNVRGISGCTILGNGDVCLILDIGSLIEMEYGEQLQAANA